MNTSPARFQAHSLVALAAYTCCQLAVADPDVMGQKTIPTQVGMLVESASHAHDPRDRNRPPAEIWYVATRKELDSSQVIYCVAPRIEIPGPRILPTDQWTLPITVQLLSEPSQKLLAEVRVPVPLQVGTSRELASSGPWCMARAAKLPAPLLILKTEHRSAQVKFPARP
jgi:hypothetical protein